MQLLKLITKTKIHLPHHEDSVHKGHTVEMHVGWDDDKLIDRFNNLQKHNPNQFDIKGASSFFNEEIVHKVLNEAKNANAKQIADWLSGPNSSKSLTLLYKSTTIIGRGITKNNPMVHDMTKVRIFIKKDINNFELMIFVKLVSRALINLFYQLPIKTQPKSIR